jgi:hypothetical protein
MGIPAETKVFRLLLPQQHQGRDGPIRSWRAPAGIYWFLISFSNSAKAYDDEKCLQRSVKVCGTAAQMQRERREDREIEERERERE